MIETKPAGLTLLGLLLALGLILGGWALGANQGIFSMAITCEGANYPWLPPPESSRTMEPTKLLASPKSIRVLSR